MATITWKVGIVGTGKASQIKSVLALKVVIVVAIFALAMFGVVSVSYGAERPVDSGKITALASDVEKVKVTFDLNYKKAPKGGFIEADKGTALKDYMVKSPVRKGYIFKGWNTLKNGKGKTFTANTKVVKAITVYAQWKKIPLSIPVTYKVFQDMNKGKDKWGRYVKSGKSSGTKAGQIDKLIIRLGKHTGLSGTIQYSTFTEGIGGIGWHGDYKSSGKAVGTAKRAGHIEAIKIKLTGTMEKYYDVKYRVYIKGVGWTVWAKNDQMSGWSKNGQKTGNGNGRYSGRYIQLMQVKITAKDVKVGKWSPPKTIKPKKTTRYDYQLFILNKYKIYDSDCAILYIKTNNPNPDSFAVTGGGGYVNPPVFEDVKYKDKENQDLRKVEGGYLKWVYNGRESGKKTIRIWEAFKGYSGDDIRFAYEGLRKYYGKEAKTISYFAYSSLTDYESHMKDIIAKSTDSSMSFHEKMGKISEYIFSNYKYYLNTTEYKDGVADMRYVFLLSNYGTWWETKEVDSYVTPFLLEDIAIELGCPKENIVNNYYIDWSRHSEIDVTYDGVTRTYSCCPPPSMNTINLDEIVYFDFSKYRERGLTRKAGWY